MINTENGRIERVTKDIINAYGTTKKSVFDKPLNEKPREPDNSKLTFKYQIQRRDIDTNNHVNNLYYLDYAMEALPEELYNNTRLQMSELSDDIKYTDRDQRLGIIVPNSVGHSVSAG